MLEVLVFLVVASQAGIAWLVARSHSESQKQRLIANELLANLVGHERQKVAERVNRGFASGPGRELIRERLKTRLEAKG